jgi:hypothetical protein
MLILVLTSMHIRLFKRICSYFNGLGADGASASVKGYPLSAAFAMGKFALRGLARARRVSSGQRASTSRIS